METKTKAASQIVRDYSRLFVNRGAYTLQSSRPDPESGRHYYFRPKAKGAGNELSLTAATIRRHLEGELTIGLYAISPSTQRSKWVAIDADYAGAMEDLLKLQYFLQEDKVEAALEMSKRGGHLWIFMERPALARECRIYIYNLALKLEVRIKALAWRRESKSFRSTMSCERENLGTPCVDRSEYTGEQTGVIGSTGQITT